MEIDSLVRKMIKEEVEKVKKEIVDELTIKFDRTLNVQELSEYLGIGKQKLYNLCATKKIPHIQIGQTKRFKLSEIEEWLKTKRVTVKE